jgi:putative phage-type endonuclease
VSLSPEDNKRVGGSDVAAIVGVSPYASAFSVYQRIVHGVELPESEAMARGTRLESAVIAWCADETGRRVRRSVSLSCREPWQRASVDALSWAAEGSRRVVEGKTSGRWMTNGWGTPGTDEVPQHYLCQVQWYMGHGLRSGQVHERVADLPLLREDFALYSVPYDEDVFLELEDRAARFVHDHVRKQVPPDVTALPQDLEMLKRRFPRHTANALDATSLEPSALYTLDEHRRAVAAAKEAMKAREKWTARVQMLLAEHEGVVWPDGTRLDWKQNKPSTVTDWEAVAKAIYADSDRAWKDVVAEFTTQREGARPLVWREARKK